MKFVTSAYKKKLMEQKKWELQEQLEEEREQRDDVTKTGMSGYVMGAVATQLNGRRKKASSFDLVCCFLCMLNSIPGAEAVLVRTKRVRRPSPVAIAPTNAQKAL